MLKVKAKASKNNAISLVMLPFVPNVKNNQTNQHMTRTPESQECLSMAEIINKQINKKNAHPVLFLGANSSNPLHKNRCLEDYFKNLMIPGSMITLVAHGNPLILGTMTHHNLTPEELAEKVNIEIETIFTNISRTKNSDSDDDTDESNLLDKKSIRTHFDFQHCNSGLYLEKSDQSAMSSFVGRFIIKMRRLGYMNVSASGYRGYVGEINNKTQLKENEELTSKIFGLEVGQLKITQHIDGFHIIHPLYFDKINVNCKAIYQEARELLGGAQTISNEIDVELPSPPRNRNSRWSNIITSFTQLDTDCQTLILQYLSPKNRKKDKDIFLSNLNLHENKRNKIRELIIQMASENDYKNLLLALSNAAAKKTEIQTNEIPTECNFNARKCGLPPNFYKPRNDYFDASIECELNLNLNYVGH